MATRTVVVGSKVGLHARPASIFCQAVAKLGVSVTLWNTQGTSVNAASILGLLSMGVSYGDVVTLVSHDEGADDALDSLVALLSSELDE